MKNKSHKSLYVILAVAVLVSISAGFYASRNSNDDLQGNLNYYKSIRTNPRYTEECLPAVAFRIEHLAKDEDFTDIEESDYQDEISFLGQMGIVEGVDQNIFDPNADLNRAEFLKMVTVAFGREVQEGAYDDEFKDVDSSEWFADYVAAGVNYDIVNGYSDGNFRPETQVSYAQALKIALRGANCGFFEEDLKDYGVYEQEYARDWYQGYMNLAEDLGIWTTAQQNHKMSREEGAKVIYDLMEYSLGTYSIDMRVVEY